jgi:glycerol dehydrogenase
VAYALFVQLVLEGRDNVFLDEMARFYRAVGLPLSLADIGLADPTEAELAAIARGTLTAPHARHFQRVLTDADLVAAMRVIEQRSRA